ncbi:MAG: glucose-6-phosphate dehydrogenase [Bacteroidota bacterium]
MSLLNDTNPLEEHDRMERIPEPCTVVIFGASGDLTRRKLMPALLDLARGGMLPNNFAVVGVARTQMETGSFRDHVNDGLKEFGQLSEGESDLWNSFARSLHYVAMDPSVPEEFGKLGSTLETVSREGGIPGNTLFYLSTPPSLYAPIVHALGASGLSRPAAPENWVRIIIEKPFGVDLDSARRLNSQVLQVFAEDQVYRIDHYLGKETVQNLLVFRFANGIFEPVWNRNYVDHVQITAAESVGVESRGGYYEQAGAMRDMIQNHMLQLLALTAMEPPVLFDAQQVRDEKHKVFTAIRPVKPEDVHRSTIRGQYAAGSIGGKDVPGYRSEQGVSAESVTETYVALKFTIDSWRWADVPFYVRSGKRLPKRVTEIAIQFKKTPHHLFTALSAPHLDRNSIAIRIQPDEGISLRFSSKIPGSSMRMRPVTMDFRYGSSFGGRMAGAYTRLLLDCMLGDATLYARGDSVDAAWSLITPIHEGWKENSSSRVYDYPAGTWGPKESDALLQGDGRRWRLP